MRKLDLAEHDGAGFARRYGPWAVIAGAPAERAKSRTSGATA